jgi:hypothetical protein
VSKIGIFVAVEAEEKKYLLIFSALLRPNRMSFYLRGLAGQHGPFGMQALNRIASAAVSAIGGRP